MYTYENAHKVGAQLHRRRVNGPTLKAQPPAAQAVSACACGGGCPRCQDTLGVHGRAAITLEQAKRRGELFVDGGETRRQRRAKGAVGAKGAPPAPATPQPAPPAPACPAQIQVKEVGTLVLDASMADQGWLTGVGGYAKMEVSDPGGRSWDGTAVHEDVTAFSDSCGTADRSCSNQDGQGGEAGSTFTVGAAGDLLGVPLAAERNCFYDIHVVAMQGVSWLHQIGKSSCTQMCYQQYDCSGVSFGPPFLIDKFLYRDMIVGEGMIYDVTRIDLAKYSV
jgi:hypothetical protein